MIKIKVDIVGGSFGGLSAAISLKEVNKSIDVIVHEKHKIIGYNHDGRRCGEAHTVESQWKKWKPIGKSVFNKISKGEVFIGNKKHVFHRKPDIGFMLNRQEFICQLARDAEKLEVNIQIDDKIKTVNELDGNYIIDASGCPSSIKRELGFNRGVKGNTYQQTIEYSNCFIPDTLKIFFTGSFGYYWIFPRDPLKKEVNVGIGFFGRFNYNVKDMLEKFKEEQKIKGTVNYVLGGLIPIGLQRPLMYKNILFVGDASVGTFPLSGQGIYRALLSGDIAGKCIASGQAKKYPHIINKEFIKWDVIGKIFNKSNTVLVKVNPKLVLTAFEYFSRLTNNSTH